MRFDSIKQVGITDVHSHAGGIDLYNLFSNSYPTTQSIRDLVAKASDNGIDNLVVFPMPSAFYYEPRALVNSAVWVPSGLEEFPYELSNKALLTEVAIYGDGRVLPFMAIHPLEEVKLQIAFLTEQAEAGRIYGLKMHTLATNTSARDLIKSPFVQLMQNFNIPILIHSGMAPEHTHPRNVIELIQQHPDLRICIAHVAGFDKNLISQIETIPGLYLDTSPWINMCNLATVQSSAHISKYTCDLNFWEPRQCLIQLFEIIPNQLLWGTDEPWTSFNTSYGDSITNSSYRTECNLLNSLTEKNQYVKMHISCYNTNKFLFGKEISNIK